MTDSAIFIANITFGEMKLKPIHYQFVDNGDGTAELRSEYGVLSGDLRGILEAGKMYTLHGAVVNWRTPA